MRTNFIPSFNLELGLEGGYSNRKTDAGGATNLGVTIGTLKSIHDDVNKDGVINTKDVKALTIDDARKIYREYYWDKAGCNDIPLGLDYAVFDFAVNSGVKRAVEHLQETLKTYSNYDGKIDGWFGPKTLKAIEAKTAHDLIAPYCANRLAFMRSIGGPKGYAANGGGWSNRVEKVRMNAERMTASVTTVPHDPATESAAPAISPPQNPYTTPEAIAGYAGAVSTAGAGLSTALTPNSPLTWAFAFAVGVAVLAGVRFFANRVRTQNERG